ncbi:Spy/CpxP family protein refolding chaperone [Bradyrhizobium genosp. L]|uniref:Spy/CpxP family protein refolding chaperone n=1 Tax=Bradyrhizobium genosp. L TaxID=83637 RepID=UPI0018A322FF|nr:Spy/CpxP family protein refolding chaperone [Bradyrhizobium genosp. L]QPF83153.1 Spy/CpxP family protein refolding chaperone [Bradyrhizobium genosp. L]
MKKVLLAGVAALAIAGSTAVYAQHRPWFHGQMRMNPEDRAAFLDARIAAVHAGLKLTADQEKLWPPVEAAVRDFAKQRLDRANARMAAEKADADKPDADKAQQPDNPVARLRERADNMAATAASLKKIADAADPLYKTLDDNQKRRLTMLTHMAGGRFGGDEERRGHERGMDRWEHGGRDHDRFDRDRDGGPDQERSGRL